MNLLAVVDEGVGLFGWVLIDENGLLVDRGQESIALLEQIAISDH